jgi:hypothetical protein
MIYGRNDAGDVHDCCDCFSFQGGGVATAGRV